MVILVLRKQAKSGQVLPGSRDLTQSWEQIILRAATQIQANLWASPELSGHRDAMTCTCRFHMITSVSTAIEEIKTVWLAQSQENSWSWKDKFLDYNKHLFVFSKRQQSGKFCASLEFCCLDISDRSPVSWAGLMVLFNMVAFNHLPGRRCLIKSFLGCFGWEVSLLWHLSLIQIQQELHRVTLGHDEYLALFCLHWSQRAAVCGSGCLF